MLTMRHSKRFNGRSPAVNAQRLTDCLTNLSNCNTGTPEPAKHTLVMGILNVTPDSFSDGGQFSSEEGFTRQSRAMIEAGADIIDIGGESSRPFSEPVFAEDELGRVIPAISAIRGFSAIPISVDTTKAVVARKALEAGADIINDISAMRADPEMISVLKDFGAPVVIMHMQGTPKTMQQAPHYDDVLGEISTFLKERVQWAEDHGLSRERIIIDPGLGFGKTVSHNLLIIKHIARFTAIGCPVLVGHSRKAFIGSVLDLPVNSRDLSTAVISALCVAQGVNILRVHDVEKTLQAVRITEAILHSSPHP